MATGIVYLDVDDEITSAAARIRSAQETKVALVVPYGSRIATSRMNFRLLSREALVNNRRLSIVASDPGARALAASAGLPVFGSVTEYEAATAAPSDLGKASATETPPAVPAPPQTPPPTVPPTDEAAPTTPRRRSKKAIAAAATAAAAAAETAAAAAAPTSGASAAPEAVSDDTQVIAFPELPAQPARPEAASSKPEMAGAGAAGAVAGDLSGRRVRLPARSGRRSATFGTPLVIGASAALLALVVLGVGGYLLLPAADIKLTPRQEPIVLDALQIRADPTATAPNPTQNVVPAISVSIPVDATQTFTTVGRKVTETKGTGVVTFSNYNPISANTIPAGSIVSTQNGIRFRTLAIVRLPVAQFVPATSTIVPSQRDVAVEAVAPGTSGNVPADTIHSVPPTENATFTRVNNAQPTSGGQHNETPQVSQKDIDAAMATLRTSLKDQFTTAVASGAGAPPNAKVFPETARVGPETPKVDPATLLGQPVATFDLGMTAEGTVIAVDSSPIRQLAETRLLSNVGADHRLVAGSVEIIPGAPVVTNGVVTFPVSARAARVRILDATELRGLIRGRSIDEARLLLAPYGDVTITTWPSWVASIPGFDARVSFDIVGQGGGAAGQPAASAGASPAASGSAGSSTSPGP